MNEQDEFVSPIDAQMAAPPNLANDVSVPSVGHAPIQVGHAPTAGGGAEKLIQNKFAVLACLFLVTGFLGLPLLWMNRRFNTAERIIWSIVVIIYTLVLFGLVGLVFLWSYRQIAGYPISFMVL